MTIRTATLADIGPIADLAQDQRVRLQGWDPSYWPIAPNARDVHPLFLHHSLTGGHSVAVVSTACGRVTGYAVASSPFTFDRRAPTLWVIDDLDVERGDLWNTTGRVLLAAIAARARAHGARRLVASCAVADSARRTAFEASGLSLNCWFRHRSLDRWTAPRQHDDTVAFEPGLPLPHVHALADAMSGADVVNVEGGSALLSTPIPPSPCFRHDGTTALVDPVVGVHGVGLIGAIDAVEAAARDRGDHALLVAVGPGEDSLDRELDTRDYSRPVEWWTVNIT